MRQQHSMVGMAISGQTVHDARPMTGTLHLRPYRAADDPALRVVFVSAVRGLASRDYTRSQIDAWSIAADDQTAWSRRMQAMQPWVVEHEGTVVAYADLQATGHIDHFYVSAQHARQGIGSLLMRQLHTEAAALSVTALCAHVSRTAAPFFARFGFRAIEHRAPLVHGIAVPNTLMRKPLP
jgi:putative acetyltransferase